MNRSLKWGLGLLLLLGAAGAFFPISAFEAALRRQIAEQVRQVSGLDTDIKGRLSFSLLPRPQIRAENVAIGTQPSMALHTPFVRGNIRLLPLLGGRIELERLTLIGPQLSLHTATSSLTRPSAQLLGELSKLGPLTIAGGSLDLQIDGRPPVQISQVDGILDPRGLPGPLSFAGRFFWNDVNGEAEVLLARLSDLFDKGATPFTAKLRSPIADAAFDGILQGGSRWQFDGHFAGTAAKPRTLMQVLSFAPALPGPLATVSANGTLRITQQALALSDASITLDANVFRGSVGVRLEGERPLISATLATPSLMLPSTELIPTLRNERQWSREPLSLAALGRTDMDLRLSAQRAILGKLTMTATGLSVLANDGKLEVLLAGAQAYGGRMKGQMTVTPIGDDGDFKGTLALTNVDAGAMLKDVVRHPRLTGIVTGEINLQSRGDSVGEHMGSLSGQLRLSARNGELAGLDAEQALRRSEKRPLSVPGEVRAGSTGFTAAEFSGTINKGTLSLERGQITGPGASINVSGAINGPDQTLRLDVGVSPPRRPEAMPANPTAPMQLNFNVQGPWEAPAFSIDTDSLIRRSEAAAGLLRAVIRPPDLPEPLPPAFTSNR
ncbi:AsmA family protein [Methylocella sp. CPCC 101449]|uniref:AsmA family protein n=1 Tax=Methylocella sp. CPCC 101449 TaxID=2987531 RepID=UPI00288E7CD7|nr:AsmA family protein [Methylocella sp. CPCC 101449]MDT2022452.1 AsmA family protein [Methylocella sp. CPCC 101449]